MKIIIVEDNADILDIMTYVLEEDGHEIISSVNCSISANISKIKPDLILLDELLPDGRGSNICKQVKADKATRHIPVIIISTVPQLEKVAANCGADACMAKPFDIGQLLNMVNSFAATTLKS